MSEFAAGTLTLERASLADVPAIVALMNKAYRGTGPEASWNTESVYLEGERISEAALTEEFASKPEQEFLVVRGDGGLRGCVALTPLGEGRWYLGSLAVDPARQKGGFGRALLAAAEAFAVGRGANVVRMTVVNVRDTLIAWYERRGYRLTGEVQPFPYGDTRFGMPLRDDLAFVVLEKAVKAGGEG